jgi:hypothetical protein
MDTNQVMALAGDVKNGQVPFHEERGMRRGQEKPHNRSNAPHARYSAFMSAYGAIPHIKEDDVCKQPIKLFNGLLMTVKSVI